MKLDNCPQISFKGISKVTNFTTRTPAPNCELPFTHYHGVNACVGERVPLAEDASESFGATENVTGTHHSHPKDLRQGQWKRRAWAYFAIWYGECSEMWASGHQLFQERPGCCHIHWRGQPLPTALRLPHHLRNRPNCLRGTWGTAPPSFRLRSKELPC